MGRQMVESTRNIIPYIVGHEKKKGFHNSCFPIPSHFFFFFFSFKKILQD